MTRTLYYGLLTGFSISIGFIASEVLFPSPAFGTLPMLLVMFIIATYWLSRGIGRKATVQKPGGDIVRAVIAAAIPFAFYGVYIVTSNGAFLSQAGGPKLILFWLMYIVLVAVPVALLTPALPDESDEQAPRTIFFGVIGAAIGLFVHQQAFTMLGLPILAVVTALATVAFPFVKDAKQSGISRKPKHQPKEKAQTRTYKQPTKKTSRHDRKKRTEQKYRPVYTWLAASLLFAFYPLWLLVHVQKAVQFLAAESVVIGILLPVLGAAVGLGMLLSGKYSQANRVWALMAGLGVFAAGIIIGMYRWQDALFAELYTAYYNGADTAYFLGEWLIWVLALPSLAMGFILGIIRSDLTANKNITLAFSAVPFLAVFGLILPGLVTIDSVHLLFVIVGSFLTLFIAALVGIHIPYSLPLRIPATLLVGGGIMVLTLNFPVPGFENLFDPSSFEIIYENQSPGGRTTLLKSRNYDDPFYTVFWNQAVAISQNSNDAKPDLQRIAHLPMLMHANPNNVLLIGLGSFEEMDALALYKPERIAVVEENPAHIHCYRAWLKDRDKEAPENLIFHAERYPAFAARNSETYDVVISGEPFATPDRRPDIFTVDYYNDIKRAVGNSGLFVQWLPLDGMTEGTFESIAAAMQSAFPNTRLWTGSMNEGSSMAAILASNAKITVPDKFHETLAEFSANPQTAFDLLQIGMPSWEYLAAEYGGDARTVRAIAGDAAPIGAFETRPLFMTTPQTLSGDMGFLRLLERRLFDPALVDGTTDSVGRMVESLFNVRTQVFRAAVQLRSSSDTSAARVLLNISQQQPYNLEAKMALANGLVRQGAQLVANGQYAAAQPILLQATSIAPLTTYMLRLLMIASYQVGDTETAQTCLNGIKRIHPKHAGIKDNEATMKAQRGQVQDALLIYENAITLDKTNEELYCNMASVQYNDGRPWEAVRILDNAIKQSYYPAKAYFLRGMIYGEGGKIDLALESYDDYFRVAKPNDPNLATAKDNVRKLETESPF